MSRHGARPDVPAIVSNIGAILLGLLLLAAEYWLVAATTNDATFALEVIAGAGALALAAVGVASVFEHRRRR
jgi:hypothetical membrane protein